MTRPTHHKRGDRTRHGRFVDIANRLPLPIDDQAADAGTWKQVFGLEPRPVDRDAYIDPRLLTGKPGDRD